MIRLLDPLFFVITKIMDLETQRFAGGEQMSMAPLVWYLLKTIEKYQPSGVLTFLLI